MRRVVLVVLAAAVVAVGLGWAMAAGVSRWFAPREATLPAAPAGATATAQSVRRISASLFYVSEDGTHLVSVQREVPHADATADQARRIVEQQLMPAPAPYSQAIPDGTKVRAVFLTDRHEAFVDLSADVSTAHPGGSREELFSIYAIVNALTVNLPAIERVQILVGGKEVDSLAGHVDLRRPLSRNMTWVARPGGAPGPPAPSPAAPPQAGRTLQPNTP
jgi:hypothetical protein